MKALAFQRGHPGRRIRRAAGRLLAATVVLLAALGPAFARADGAELARLEHAAIAHPEDPDLAWALARALARAGRAPEAADATRRFVARWPAHRPAARLEIARELLDRGAAPEAEPLLAAELRRVPDSGVAHFYHGLALRGCDAPEAAELALVRAARLEPALRADALLVRALVHLDHDREERAVALLIELLRFDPTGETALRARLLLRDQEIARGKDRWRVDARAGFEWDDNVTLEPAESETPPSGRRDFRGVWGAGISGQPWRTERAGLLIGYRYDQTHHAELNDFDVIQNAVFASLSTTPSDALRDRLALRLDAYAYDTLQDLDQALVGAAFRPGVLWSLGPKLGVTRLFGAFEVVEFDAQPILEVWERDSIAGGLGLEQTVPLPLAGSFVAVSFAWLRTLTQAGPDGSALGFDGDFDADSYRVRSLADVQLPFSVRAQLEASYTRDAYLNDNFAYLSESGRIAPREDDVIGARVSLSRPVLPFTRLEIYWRGAWRASNVSLFDYDKNLVGLLFHVSSSG